MKNDIKFPPKLEGTYRIEKKRTKWSARETHVPTWPTVEPSGNLNWRVFDSLGFFGSSNKNKTAKKQAHNSNNYSKGEAMFRVPHEDDRQPSRRAHPGARLERRPSSPRRDGDGERDAPMEMAPQNEQRGPEGHPGNAGNAGNGLGNTRQARYWQFTYNREQGEQGSETEWIISSRRSIEDAMRELGDAEFCYQLERGEENERLHMQGCFRHRNKRGKWRFNVIRGIFERYNARGIHLEVARRWKNVLGYSCKTDTRIDGPWSNLPDEELEEAKSSWSATNVQAVSYYAPRDPMRDMVPRMWQQEAEEILEEEPDRRTIHWFWEPVGNVGKSTWITSYCIRHQGEVIAVNGKSNDIFYAIAEHYSVENQKSFRKMKLTWKPYRVIFIDVPREQGDKVNYRAIEEIKNGRLFNGKYKSGMVLFDSPHIMVFANAPPNREKFSEDRWCIHEITDVDMAPLNESEAEEEEGASNEDEGNE